MAIEKQRFERFFSKEPHVEVRYSGDDLQEGLRRLMALPHAAPSYSEWVARGVEQAKGLLADRGLPTVRWVSFSRSRQEWLPKDEVADGDCAEDCRLDDYIYRKAGYPIDCIQHLAAQYILVAKDVDDPDREKALRAAHSLGKLWERTRRSALEQAKRRRQGEASKRRTWADDLARVLVSRGARSPSEARRMLDEANSPIKIDEDHHAYLDGDTVVCADSVNDKAKPKTITWVVFQKTYLKPARNGGKRR